jgi:5-methylcytosine-specific restriction endonuclease McrA
LPAESILPDSKACSKCLVEKPLDDFHKQTATKDGHQSICKDCVSIAQKARIVKTPEAIEAAEKARAKKEADDLLWPDSKVCSTCLVRKSLDDFSKSSAARDGYKVSCKDCRQEYQKIHYQNNLEAFSEIKKAYYAKNRDRELAYAKEYRSENRHKFNEGARRYRSRKLKNGVEYYTEAQVLELYGTDCHICSLPIDLDAPRSTKYEGWQMGLQIDHIQPISKQGPDTLNNVRPSHGVCNNKKKATWEDPASFNED